MQKMKAQIIHVKNYLMSRLKQFYLDFWIGNYALISNVPIYGLLVEDRTMDVITDEHIAESISYYTGHNVVSIKNISQDSYLVQMATRDQADEIGQVFSGMFLGGNCLQVSYPHFFQRF